MSNVDLAKAQQFADDYVEHYEMEADEGTYHPSERERFLIEDAINGLIGDEDFCDLIANEVLERQERRAAAGDCLGCGAPKGTHWGQCDGKPQVKFGPSSSPETSSAECSCNLDNEPGAKRHASYCALNR